MTMWAWRKLEMIYIVRNNKKINKMKTSMLPGHNQTITDIQSGCPKLNGYFQ